jgi:hypothetical protein
MRASILAVGFALSLFGCNSILGMERARLDEGGDAGPEGAGGATVTAPKSTGGTTAQLGVNYTDCTSQSAACEACLEASSCGTSNCLGDYRCRAAISAYTQCLDRSLLCGDKSCVNGLTSYTGQINSPLSSTCIEQCPDCKPTLGILPICKLYCSCMQATCKDEFKSLGDSVDECVSQCESSGEKPSLTLCKESHCEAAANPDWTDPAIHCQHAAGTLPACLNDVKVCSLKPNGFAGCEKGGECCSGTCMNHVCTG